MNVHKMSLLSQRAVNEGGEGWTLPLDLLLNSSSMVPCSAGEIRNSGRGKEKVCIASYISKRYVSMSLPCLREDRG